MTVLVPFAPLRSDVPEMPRAMRSGDAAADLRAAEAFTLEPGERALVPTGWSVAVPEGMAGLVLARSGLAIKHGISLVNSPGLVDPGYRGELAVILINHGRETFSAEVGDRIAQFLMISLPDVALTAVGELPDAIDLRGESGFGSSGTA